MPENHKIHFEPTITFGNICTIVTMIGTLIGLYITHDRRITILEANSVTMQTQVTAQTILLSKASENQAATTRSVDRLTLLFDERFGKPK